MSSTARPTDHAVIAHLADAASLEAALTELSHNQVIDLDEVRSGTGEAFASELQAGDADAETGTGFMRWILSLGQEREELVRLGQVVREGRHGLVINGVDDEGDLEAISSILKRHGAADIIYFGDWNTEDLSINR